MQVRKLASTSSNHCGLAWPPRMVAARGSIRGVGEAEARGLGLAPVQSSLLTASRYEV